MRATWLGLAFHRCRYLTDFQETNKGYVPYILAYYPLPQINRSRNFSHIRRIKGNLGISRRSIDLFTGDDTARSINHKTLIFTGKCNESPFYCSKSKKSSSSEEESSSISRCVRFYVACISRRQNTGHIPCKKLRLICEYISNRCFVAISNNIKAKYYR